MYSAHVSALLGACCCPISIEPPHSIRKRFLQTLSNIAGLSEKRPPTLAVRRKTGDPQRRVHRWSEGARCGADGLSRKRQCRRHMRARVSRRMPNDQHAKRCTRLEESDCRLGLVVQTHVEVVLVAIQAGDASVRGRVDRPLDTHLPRDQDLPHLPVAVGAPRPDATQQRMPGGGPARSDSKPFSPRDLTETMTLGVQRRRRNTYPNIAPTSLSAAMAPGQTLRQLHQGSPTNIP